MSSFINSLLNELGTRTRLRRHPQPINQAGITRSRQTKPPSTGDQKHTLVHDTGLERGGLDTTARDEVISHDPPFIATVSKDMDRSSSEPGITRTVPHNGQGVDQATGAAESLPEAAHTAGIASSSARVEDSQSQYPGPTGPHDPISLAGLGRVRSPPRDTYRLDELDHPYIPADDGMGWLRKKIHAIRALDLSNSEKARMIHDLMTERYNATQTKSPVLSTATSPAIVDTSLGDVSVVSREEKRSNQNYFGPTLTAPTTPVENHFSLSHEDLKPTYAPKPDPESPTFEAGEEDSDTEELEASLGCPHYQRNVKLQCHTCRKWYTCRFCHDEIEDHHLIRRDTENMLCMLCGHAQSAAQNCRKCEEQTAQYYCDICKLWDNDGKKSIYHCNDCGICRIGQGLGKDFFHCKTCCVCLPISIEDTHRCIERSTQCDCPICGDYMFTSPETVVVMRCGHSIHSKCLSEHSKSSFRCPICSKTIANMESTFRNLDRTIESQPMPAEFKDTRGLIYCNDCGAKSVVKYHWLGLKCDLCESYNTAQIRVLQGDVSAILEEENLNQIHARPRSFSLATTEDSAVSTPALPMNTTPTPQSRLSVPVSAGADGRFVSYNMTHGRAVSPVVSNYFGLPSERAPEKSSSLPFLGSISRAEKEGDYGALSFLSKKFRDRYGFLADEPTLADGPSEAEEVEEEDDDDDDQASFASATDEEIGDGDEDDEDDEGAEYIDIFGHR